MNFRFIAFPVAFVKEENNKQKQTLDNFPEHFLISKQKMFLKLNLIYQGIRNLTEKKHQF